MCFIDFKLPVEQDDSEMLLTQDSVGRNIQNLNVKKKTKYRKNFEVVAIENPVLFLTHIKNNSFFMIDKPWLEVVKSLEASPVHRHIFGS